MWRSKNIKLENELNYILAHSILFYTILFYSIPCPHPTFNLNHMKVGEILVHLTKPTEQTGWGDMISAQTLIKSRQCGPSSQPQAGLFPDRRWPLNAQCNALFSLQVREPSAD